MSSVKLLPESPSTSPHFHQARAMLNEFQNSGDIELDGESLSIPSVVAIAKKRLPARIRQDKNLITRTEESVQFLKEHLQNGYQVYGVSTGFGGSADTRTTDHEGLQTALLQTIQTGVLPGADFAPTSTYSDQTSHSMPPSWVRATMVVRCNHLLRGHSAVRYRVIEALLLLVTSGMTPVLPLRGSISASGDLLPLAYIAGVLEGNPDIKVSREAGDGTSDLISAPEALRLIGLDPVTLGPKEGLGLLNGAAASSAVGSIVMFETNQLMVLCQVIITMSCEALLGKSENYHHFVAAIRPHQGQIEVARNIRYFLQGSRLVETAETKDRCRTVLFQDRYALRGTSQWIGPQLEDMRLSTRQIQIELNSTQDNPVIDVEGGDVHSGCNFQAASVTSAVEKARLSLQMAGKPLFGVSSELINPDLNQGLPPNLCAEYPDRSFFAEGVDVNMAAYMSELAFLANPVSSHVQCAEMCNQAVNSLAFISSRYTMQSVELVSLMTAAHLYVVCQALDLRALHTRFQDSLLEGIRHTVREAFSNYMGRNQLEALEEASISRVAQSWACTARENLDNRCRILADDLVGCAMNSFAKDKLCDERGQLPTLRTLESFRKCIHSKSRCLFQMLRNIFLDKPWTVHYVGAASGKMYKFVREELRVPFHRGLAEHPTVECEPDLGRERKTIGSWITLIYVGCSS